MVRPADHASGIKSHRRWRTEKIDADLALVRCVLLRVDTRLAPLAHVAQLLTSFLDVAVLVPLTKAAASGSLRLFDRVAARVACDTSESGARKRHRFALALREALERDDLDIVKRIHAIHPDRLGVFASVSLPPLHTATLGLALQHGTLETVQWVIENRCDRLCCQPGVENLCRGCLQRVLPCIGDRDTFRIVVWLIERGAIGRLDLYTLRCLSRAMELSCELVAFLNEHRLLDQDILLSVLLNVVRVGNEPYAMQLLELLKPSILSQPSLIVLTLTAAARGLEALVSKLIGGEWYDDLARIFTWTRSKPEAKTALAWNGDVVREIVGNMRISNFYADIASRFGDLDTITTMYQERNLLPVFPTMLHNIHGQSLVVDALTWLREIGATLPDASLLMDMAAGLGYLDVVQWFHHNSDQGCSRSAMDRAACNGHLDVVKWLRANRTEGCSLAAFSGAARSGHLHVLIWFYENNMLRDVPAALKEAAQHGHLEVLIWLTELPTIVKCARCISRRVFHGSKITHPSVDVLRWMATVSRDVHSVLAIGR